ncbi:MAG TPA: glycosyltransferase family 2 protein [Actinomycetota bacterium]
MTADLAVVVVNFNAGEHLRSCVASVYAAAGDLDLDVVIVDNASRDGSAGAAAAAHPSIRVINNRVNRGFAAAANRGFAETQAPFIFLLNPDAVISGGRLDAFVKVAKERPRVGALGCLVRNPDGSLQPSARKVPGIGEGLAHAFLGRVAPDNRWSRSYTMADWDRASEREVEWVSGSAMLVRREAVDAVGGFDEGYFMYVEDVDLCTRLRKRGWSALFTPELEVTHEVGVSTRSHPRRMAYEHSRSIYRYFSTHVATGPGTVLRPLARATLWARAALIARRSPEDRVAGPRRRPR